MGRGQTGRNFRPLPTHLRKPGHTAVVSDNIVGSVVRHVTHPRARAVQRAAPAQKIGLCAYWTLAGVAAVTVDADLGRRAHIGGGGALVDVDADAVVGGAVAMRDVELG